MTPSLLRLFCVIALAMSASLQALALELTVQSPHTTRIEALAASPDGRWLASASRDGTVKLVDTQTGILLRTMPHGGPVNDVAFSPDGVHIAAACWDGHVYLWHIEELAPTLLEGHAGEAERVAFSPDGRVLASGGRDTQVRLWNPTTGALEHTLSAHTKRILALGFSPDSRQLVTSSRDKTVQQWDVETGTRVRTLGALPRWSRHAHFSPDGRFIASSGGEHVQVWEASTGALLHTFTAPGDDGDIFYTTLFAPDSRTLLSATNHAVQIWDTAQPDAPPRLLPTGDVMTRNIAISPDGQIIAAATQDRLVRVWDTASGQQRLALEPHGGAEDILFSADSRTLIAGGGTLELFDVTRGVSLYAFDVSEGDLDAVALSPDGRLMLAGNASGELHLWDRTRAARIPLKNTPHSDRVTVAAAGPRSQRFASGSRDNTVKVWSDQGALLHTFQHQDWLTDLVFSPDGKLLASASKDGSAKVWDLKTGALLHDFAGSGWVLSLAFSPDGTTLATGSDSLALWDLSTGKRTHALYLRDDWINNNLKPIADIAFSPDGARVITANWNHDVQHWDVSSGELLHAFQDHDTLVNRVAFHPDGAIAASADNDGDLILWDLEAGTRLHDLKGHTRSISTLHFTPDGTHLVSTGYDQSIRVWDTATGGQTQRFDVDGAIYDAALSADGRWLATGAADGSLVLRDLLSDDDAEIIFLAVGEEWLVYASHEGQAYFDASPRGGELAAMVQGTTPFRIDQFALVNNRPDLILAALDIPRGELAEHYQTQHQRRVRTFHKRLRERDVAETSLPTPSFDLHLPTATIEAAEQRSPTTLTLSLRFEDPLYALAFYQIFVNDVPVFPGLGKTPDVEGTWQLEETLELGAGHNKVEVSVINVNGAESFRAATFAQGAEPESPGDLYLLAFGVSDYADDTLDLSFADKDAHDLAKLFSRAQGFSNIHIHTFTNAEVTRDSFRAAHALLERARVHDTVVLFIAGHGLHERTAEARYFYLTHDTDLENLAETAAPFELIEGILDGIPPRRKLFLMDTCESGEQEGEAFATTLEGAKSRGLSARGLPSSRKSSASRSRTFLYERDRYIYNDISRRTGAVVFSSSRGGELSYESSQVENGLFTEAVITALTDTTRGVPVSTRELRVEVARSVAEMSQDLQHPTVDRDNLAVHIAFLPIALEGDVSTLPAPPQVQLPAVPRGPRGCACRLATPSPGGHLASGALILGVVVVFVWRTRRR